MVLQSWAFFHQHTFSGAPIYWQWQQAVLCNYPWIIRKPAFTPFEYSELKMFSIKIKIKFLSVEKSQFSYTLNKPVIYYIILYIINNQRYCKVSKCQAGGREWIWKSSRSDLFLSSTTASVWLMLYLFHNVHLVCKLVCSCPDCSTH